MDLLFVHQAARLLGVHDNTVRNLERKGQLKSFRDHRGYRLFPRDVLEKLKKQRGSLIRTKEPKEGKQK